MSTDHRPYRCRLCGAASYQRLLHRNPDGAMTYSGVYRCSGCAVDFADPLEWRDAPLELSGTPTAASH